MRKAVFVIFAAFMFFLVSPVSAAAPVCDPIQVDMSKPITLSASSQADCDSVVKKAFLGDSIYCDSTSYTGSLSLVGGVGCWPKGPTTRSPDNLVCPSGSSSHFVVLAQKVECCQDNVGGPGCVEVQPISLVCNPVGNTQFAPVGGKCVAQGRTNVFLCLTEKCDTAIGQIPVQDLPGFLRFLLRFAFGIAGGIILLMLILTGYNILTSSGNPEKLQAAKENLVSIFTGLVLIFFSIVLLQAIGAGILSLPTF